jgi:hypothetical protein
LAIVLTAALSTGAGGSAAGQTGLPNGGTVRAGLLFTDDIVHYVALPPGYDYFLDPQAGGDNIEWELFRCCLLRTLLSYNVEAQIGGKLAQLGQRLINSAAKKTADDFFVKFAEAVAKPA